MKKSELRKLIREVISEQLTPSGDELTPTSYNWNTNPNSVTTQLVSPVLSKFGPHKYKVYCPSGYKFDRKSPYDWGQTTISGDSAQGFYLEYPQSMSDTGGLSDSDINLVIPACAKMPDKDFAGNPGKAPTPPNPGKDPLGDAPVGGGGFGTANLGGLPSN